MKAKGIHLAFNYFVPIIMACMIILPSAHGAFFYKSYVMRYDRGWNILCDPYVVKKDDWVFKLFRQKGEISHSDFPEFLRIFKRLNPHIHDIDRIRPGQHIIIPLKKVDRDTLPGSSSDVVTIPFLTSATLPESTTKDSTEYRVKSGDCVSVLISKKFGNYGSESYKEGEKLFKLMNPEIDDLNLIYAGQVIRLPDPQIQPQMASQSLALRESTQDTPSSVDIPDTPEQKTTTSFLENKEERPSSSPLSEVASVLDAELFDKGIYYLPREGQEDFKIDLSRTPFIKLEDGTRILFITDAENQTTEMSMLKSFWQDVHIIQMSPGDSMAPVLTAVLGSFEAGVLKNSLSFTDHGVDVDVRGKWIIAKPREAGEAIRHLCITFIDDAKERTPAPIIRYLDQNNIIVKDILLRKDNSEPKSQESHYNITSDPLKIIYTSDHKAFVNDFLVAMGYQYSPNTSISFEYAGVQIDTFSNLAAKNDGNSFFIDFGNFYGEAVNAIEKSGHRMIQVNDNDTVNDIIRKLLGAMDVSFTINPEFLAAKRPESHNTRLTIPGFLVENAGKPEMLLTRAPLHRRVAQFLTDKDIKIIRIEFQGKKNE